MEGAYVDGRGGVVNRGETMLTAPAVRGGLNIGLTSHGVVGFGLEVG